MKENDADIQSIILTINLYFKSSYEGNAKILQEIFHPEAMITGYINNQLQNWNLSDFIKRVTSSPTAAERNEVYNKKIILIDISGDIAIVKTRVSVGVYFFTDYITLIKDENSWRIRYKSFTTV
jgi:hypothetical protein